MARTIILLILGTLGLVACAPVVTPGDDPDAVHLPTEAGESAYSEDLLAYAEEMGIEPEEAARRFEIMDAIGTLQAQLATDEAESFAGLWLEHEPEFRVVVAFTDNGEERIRPYIASQPYEEYVEVRTHRYSLAELEAAQREATAVASQLGLAVTSGISLQNNRVELTVGNPTLFEEELRTAGLALPEPVELRAVDPENLPASNRGGVDLYEGPDGQTIYFPRQAPTGASMEALLQGTLILDENGCLRIGEEQGGALLIIWHHDFELRIEEDRVEVLDGEGQVVGRVGEAMRVGGGEGGNRLDLPGLPHDLCPGPYWILGDIDPLEVQLMPLITASPFSTGEGVRALLHQSPPAREEGSISGTLLVDEQGCLHVDGYVPVWPEYPVGIWAREEGDSFRLVRVEGEDEVTVAAPGEEVRLFGAEQAPEDYQNYHDTLPCSAPYWGVSRVEPAR